MQIYVLLQTWEKSFHGLKSSKNDMGSLLQIFVVVRRNHYDNIYESVSNSVFIVICQIIKRYYV